MRTPRSLPQAPGGDQARRRRADAGENGSGREKTVRPLISPVQGSCWPMRDGCAAGGRSRCLRNRMIRSDMTDRERWPRLRALGPFAMFLVVAVVAVGLVTTGAWFASTDATDVLAAHGCRAALAALVTFGLTSVNLVLRWLRWGFLLRRHHVRMPTRDTFRLFFMTLPAVLTPLYLGEHVRVAVVSRSAPRAGPAVFWTWIVERSSDAGALLLLWGLVTQRC